jgi:hypothetical protein
MMPKYGAGKSRQEAGTASSWIMNFCLNMERNFFSLTTNDMTFFLAIRINFHQYFSETAECSVMKWLAIFLKNPQLALRKPLATSFARGKCFMQEYVDTFSVYSNLKLGGGGGAFSRCNMFSVGENELTVAQHKASKVFAMKSLVHQQREVPLFPS